ncbi:proteasome (prosome, macropain) assembly chaperone 4 [Balamuthia mandrillaris]
MNVVVATEAASEASAAAATNATTTQAKPAQPCIKIHNFSDEFMDTPIYFQVTCLQDSYLIWMGTSLPRLADLCVAVPTRYVRIYLSFLVLVLLLLFFGFFPF